MHVNLNSPHGNCQEELCVFGMVACNNTSELAGIFSVFYRKVEESRREESRPTLLTRAFQIWKNNFGGSCNVVDNKLRRSYI